MSIWFRAVERALALLCGSALCIVPASIQGVSELPGDRVEATYDPAFVLRELEAVETARTELTGRVVGPDGAAVAGAIVVTSEGGHAVSDIDGSYSLELRLPVHARTLRVTAVAGSGQESLAGSTLLEGIFPASWTRVGTIALERMGSCEPSWLPTFGREPGINNTVYALAVFDDGSGGGAALYAGGQFWIAGGAPAEHIARWDGSSWTPLGGGVNANVLALEVYDDGSGSGPALYVGGGFTSAGGIPANRIAKWDGATWSSVGGGLNGGVWALVVFDDGSGGGPTLYAGGDFTSAGGVPADRLAKWDGSSWTSLGSGVDSVVLSLEVYDDGGGSGAALYAGGLFTSAGGIPANRIARWDGASWSPLGSGVEAGASTTLVRALEVFDNGPGGPKLYAGGTFTIAGGVTANNIAVWDGSSWAPVGGGMTGGLNIPTVRTLTRFQDVSGGPPALYAGGDFIYAGGVTALRMAKWDGTSWSALGSGLSAGAYALATYDDRSGAGPALFVGGYFSAAGGEPTLHIAKWSGASWPPLSEGLNGAVTALTVFDDGGGGGPELYVGGEFNVAGGIFAHHVARWDGTTWSTVGSLNGAVRAFAVFDDASGGGPALYAGGSFTNAGYRIAKWNGTHWSGVGFGTSDTVRALTVFDPPGPGRPELCAAGDFTEAGSITANHIAKWDGTSWSYLRSGWNQPVTALEVFDDGSGNGPALYVGGYFTYNADIVAHYIAKWDGSNWMAVSGGTDSSVHALKVFDDGSGAGPALYVGGYFTQAGGVSAKGIAKWDGTTWSALGSGVSGSGGSASGVIALDSFEDLSTGGSVLYAGGYFSNAGGAPASCIAQWDGASWSPLGGGTNYYVLALASFDDGSAAGPSLLAGGLFTTAFDSGDSYLARWGLPPSCGLPGAPFCFGDGSGAACPCSNEAPGGGGCANSGGSGALLSATGSAEIANDSLLFVGEDLLPGQPALLFQGENAIGGGQGVGFGDGLRCAGGAVIRMRVLVPDGNGSVSYPGAGDPSVSIAGEVQAGDTRRYQIWYRDPVGGPCSSGFNLTNGYEIAWE